MGPEDRASHAWNARRTAAYRGHVWSSRPRLRVSDLRYPLLLQHRRWCGASPCGNIDQGAAANVRVGNHGEQPRTFKRARKPAAAYVRPGTVGAGARNRSPGKRTGSMSGAALGSGTRRWDAVWLLPMESGSEPVSTSTMPATGQSETGDLRSRTIHLSAFDAPVPLVRSSLSARSSTRVELLVAIGWVTPLPLYRPPGSCAPDPRSRKRKRFRKVASGRSGSRQWLGAYGQSA